MRPRGRAAGAASNIYREREVLDGLGPWSMWGKVKPGEVAVGVRVVFWSSAEEG